MDIRSYITESLTRVRQNTLNVVSSLTREQLTWCPGPEANSIGFLLFHVFRTEDTYLHRWVQPGQQLFDLEGWNHRWKLPTQEPRPWAAQEARAFEAPLDQLLAYGAAVRASGLHILQNLDVKRLEEKPNPNRPNVTVANFLQNMCTHEAHHQGAIEYLVGLQKSQA